MQAGRSHFLESQVDSSSSVPSPTYSLKLWPKLFKSFIFFNFIFQFASTALQTNDTWCISRDQITSLLKHSLFGEKPSRNLVARFALDTYYIHYATNLFLAKYLPFLKNSFGHPIVNQCLPTRGNILQENSIWWIPKLSDNCTEMPKYSRNAWLSGWYHHTLYNLYIFTSSMLQVELLWGKPKIDFNWLRIHFNVDFILVWSNRDAFECTRSCCVFSYFDKFEIWLRCNDAC